MDQHTEELPIVWPQRSLINLAQPCCEILLRMSRQRIPDLLRDERQSQTDCGHFHMHLPCVAAISSPILWMVWIGAVGQTQPIEFPMIEAATARRQGHNSPKRPGKTFQF